MFLSIFHIGLFSCLFSDEGENGNKGGIRVVLYPTKIARREMIHHGDASSGCAKLEGNGLASECDWVIHEMEEAKKRGLKVAVNGVNYSGLSREKLQMFLEESPYMMDFVGDERGHIVAINFDKITDF